MLLPRVKTVVSLSVYSAVFVVGLLFLFSAFVVDVASLLGVGRRQVVSGNSSVWSVVFSDSFPQKCESQSPYASVVMLCERYQLHTIAFTR